MSEEELFTDIKTKFSQGQQLIKYSQNSVLFLGQTGSGKSTIINALIGNQLIVTKIGIQRNLSVGQTRPGFQNITIGHRISSQTSIPNHCYDPDTGLAFQDCPGYEQNRGLAQDILNAFYVKRVCQMTNGAIICLILDYNDLLNSRLSSFLNLISQISKQFDKSIDFLRESIVVVVNRVKQNSLQEIQKHLKYLIEQLFLQQDIHLKEQSRKILGYLLQSQHSVCVLNIPQVEGEFYTAEFRNFFIEMIKNKVPLKLEPNITLSNRWILELTSLFKRFAQNIGTDLEKLSQLLIQEIDKYVDEAENTHVFDDILLFVSQATQIIDEVIAERKMMREDQLERLMQFALPLVSSNQKIVRKFNKFSKQLMIQNFFAQVILNNGVLSISDFLSSMDSFGNVLRRQREWIESLPQICKNLIMAFPEFSNEENYSLESILSTIGLNFIPQEWKIPSKKFQIDKLKFTLFQSPGPEVIFSNYQTIHISGYFIRLSQIIPLIENQNSIIITAAFLVYIDTDLKLPGKNLAFFAPFCMSENKIIDLKGKDGQVIRPEKAITGQDGQPGNFGQNGGHFVIGVYDYKVLPKIDTSGGTGGNGQNGGDGLNGADGIDAVAINQSDNLVDVQSFQHCNGTRQVQDGTYQTITDYNSIKLTVQKGTKKQQYDVTQWEAYQAPEVRQVFVPRNKNICFGLIKSSSVSLEQQTVMVTKYRPKNVQKEREVPNLQQQETKMPVFGTKTKTKTEAVLKDQQRKCYKKEGTLGEKGKDSGRGGKGGKKGKHGKFLFINIRYDQTFFQHPQEGLVRNNGEEGMNGEPGQPGKGGVQGKTIQSIFNTGTQQWENQVQIYSSIRAQDGKMPEGLNTYGIQESPENSFYEFSQEIQRSIQFFKQRERLEGERILTKFQVEGLELYETRLGERNWFIQSNN